MQVQDAMTRDCRIVNADETIQNAARLMAEEGVGCLPVGGNGRLVGMLTDRDIVTRCVAQGKNADSRVRDAMTEDIKYCFADEDLNHIVLNMASNQMRRIPVMNRDKRIVGMLSLSDAGRSVGARATGAAFCAITTRGGPHAGDQMKQEPLDNGIPMSQAAV